MAGVVISRRFVFSSSHRYYRDDWSAEENAAAFGANASPHGHGHNYVLEVAVTGEPDPQTGMVINLVDLESTVERIVAEFDHKHLNLDTPYFADRVPTTENFTVVLWELIQPALRGWKLERVRLYESEDLYVDYMGEAA